jgi:hypothetical protein
MEDAGIRIKVRLWSCKWSVNRDGFNDSSPDSTRPRVQDPRVKTQIMKLNCLAFYGSTL